jgi:hypothetical protein
MTHAKVTRVLGAADIAEFRSLLAVFGSAFGDDAAIALYTRLGTREDVMHFDIVPCNDDS